MITAFENIYNKTPQYTTIEKCLERIKKGASKKKVDEIRTIIDRDRANGLKGNLPSICFSGKFGPNRTDAELIEHSGFIILDFDHVENPETLKHELIANDFIKATWVSPSGNGVKALVKIADPGKHKEHFQALQELFPGIDKSGINPSRVCYESFDPEIFIKENVKPFTKVKIITRQKESIPETDNSKTFDLILKWLSNKGDAFVSGERNTFIFKLASACCRFGLSESEAEQYINNSILINDNTFTQNEAIKAIRSAYKANQAKQGTAQFENSILVERSNKKEIEIDLSIYDLTVRPKDVIYGEDVKEDALKIYDNGHESACTTYVNELDKHFKWKRGEITLLSGIGNYGKSTFLKYLLLLQVINEGKKFAIYSPEDCPAQEFYHDLVEMYTGLDCTPNSKSRVERGNYEAIYDFISHHIFFVYPKDIVPTPDYIKERFLELIIKEGVSGCVIDPFNQMDNDDKAVGGRDDKYLSTVFSDFQRFSQMNQVYFVIVAHPRGHLKKDSNGNYECPDVFDLAGGAMWNNKMDNILIYHRPRRGQDAADPTCSIYIKKVRRQKIVGIPGDFDFELSPKTRRFVFGNQKIDYIGLSIYNATVKPNENFEL